SIGAIASPSSCASSNQWLIIRTSLRFCLQDLSQWQIHGTRSRLRLCLVGFISRVRTSHPTARHEWWTHDGSGYFPVVCAQTFECHPSSGSMGGKPQPNRLGSRDDTSYRQSDIAVLRIGSTD